MHCLSFIDQLLTEEKVITDTTINPPEVAVTVNLTAAIVVPIVVILLIVGCGSLILVVVCGVKDRKKKSCQSDTETSAFLDKKKDTTD